MRIKPYLHLIRLHKPAGIILLLWPTLWALWLATKGYPDLKIFCIFILGVVIMRSAGCIINDFADRKFDGHVARTKQRPLATGQVSVRSSLILFVVLLTSAFLLVLCLNSYTVTLAFVGAFLAIVYPFLKRITHLPQFGLGLAYSWGVPMAYAAETNTIPPVGWLLFSAAVLWPVIYDTMYAMTDKADDLKIQLKSTAILFETKDKIILAGLQIVFLVMMGVIGYEYHLNLFYSLSLVSTVILFIYQQFLIKDRQPELCFKAFLNNQWVGCVIFLGIVWGLLR